MTLKNINQRTWAFIRIKQYTSTVYYKHAYALLKRFLLILISLFKTF